MRFILVGVRLRQMCNCVICSRPCQSNAESAGMPCLKHLWHAPMLRIALVTWHGCFESRFGAVFRNICASKSRHRDETSVSHQPSGADWPSGEPGEFPVAWQPIWPAALHFFLYIIIIIILYCRCCFCCLPNALKWLFPNSPFNNKTLINNALTGKAIRRASAQRTRDSRMEWKCPGGAERQNCPVQGFKCRSVTSVNRLLQFYLCLLS